MKRSHQFVFFLIWLVVAATFLFSLLQFANLSPRSAPANNRSTTNDSPRPARQESR